MNPIRLPLSLLDFRFDCEDARRLPAFPGSAWRGALGWSLKRTVCVIRDTACRDCLLYRSCLFPHVFETPPPLSNHKDCNLHRRQRQFMEGNDWGALICFLLLFVAIRC